VIGTRQPFPARDAQTKQRPFPSPRVLLSRRLERYYGRLRRPPGIPPTSRLSTGYRARRSGASPRPPGRGGPPQFPPSPSERSAPSTPGGSSGLRIQALHPFHGLHPEGRGWAPPRPGEPGTLTTRQASLDATDRSVAPPIGLSTLGSDPARYQTEPPACYRASWQLPGRDSHPQATTSLCWNRYSISNLQTLGAPSEVL
jgi:hypothetical protein